MTTRLLLLLALCWPLAAGAQMFDDEEGGTPSTPPRSIPLNTSGNVAATLAAYGVTPTFCKEFSSAVGATHTGTCGGAPALTMTVAGTPVLTTVPLWPATIAGAAGGAWTMNGTNAYLTVADNAVFEPAGSFTVVCAITPSTVTGSYDYISHYESTGNQRSWDIGRANANLVFYSSCDGVVAVSNTLTSALAIGRTVFFTHTFTAVGAGNSTSTWYVDNLATDTATNLNGPVFNSTANDEIMASDTGAGLAPDRINFCAILPGVATEAQHDQAFAIWQGRAPVYGGVATVANSAPMAIAMAPQNSGIEPFIIQQPANSQYLRNGVVMKGLCSPGAVTNEAWRRSFESPAAPGAPTGWTLGGTGAGLTLVNSTAHSAHGTQSLLATSDGSGAMTAASGCGAITKNVLYQMDIWAMSTAGTGDAKVSLVEDDSSDCSSPLLTTDVVTVGNAATWTQYTGSITTGNDAGTRYGQVLITFNATAQTTHVDAVSLYANATRHIGFCSGDTDADAVCTASSISTTDPITWRGNTSVEGTFSGPNVGTVLATDAYLWASGVPGSGNDKVNAYVDSTTDEPGITIRDSAGGVLSTEPNVANWTGAEVALKWKFNNAGTLLSEWWNSAWNSTTAGAGTGIRAATNATMYLGGDGTTGSDICFHDIVVRKKLIP